jgi:hypothetical protein
MMFPHSYSAPMPAPTAATDAAADAAPTKPEPAPWINPRWLLLVGLAVLAVAYVQREARDAPPQPSYFMKTDAWACPSVTDLSDAQRLIRPDNVAAVEARLVAAGCRMFSAGAWVALAYKDGAFSRVHRDGGYWVASRALEERKP